METTEITEITETKTTTPPILYPHYRATTYETMEGQPFRELCSWYEWYVMKGLSVALAHSAIAMSKDYVAVWIIGKEYVDQHNLRYNKGNSEPIGEIIWSHNWPGRENKNELSADEISRQWN